MQTECDYMRVSKQCSECEVAIGCRQLENRFFAMLQLSAASGRAKLSVNISEYSQQQNEFGLITSFFFTGA